MTSSLTLTVSFFQRVEGKTPTLRELTFKNACDLFAPHFPPILTREQRKTKGRPFSFNIYKTGTTRGKENVEFMTGVVLDFDNKNEFVFIESVTEKLEEQGLIHFWYTTWSHTEIYPRWRLIVPFSQPLPVKEWKAVYDRMGIFLDSPPGIDHPASRDVAHLWYSPSRNAGHPFQSRAWGKGTLLNPLYLEDLLTLDQKAKYVRQQQSCRKESVLPFQEFPQSNLEEAEEILRFLNADCEYGIWIRIGMALHHHFGGTLQAFNLWSDWSRRSPKFPGEKSLLTHWNSFSPRAVPVSIGTLVYHARQNGYSRFPKKTFILPISSGQLPGTSRKKQKLSTDDRKLSCVVSQEELPLQEEDEEHEKEESEEEENQTHFDFFAYEQYDPFDFPSPLLQEIYGYLLSCSSYHNPLYALASSVVLSGFLLRNTLESPTGLRTNFMALSIGLSGTGKTQILKGVQKILIEAGQKQHFVSSLGTIQGCIEALRQKNSCLFLVQDEASYAAKAMKNRNTSSHEQNIEKFKMDTFSMQPLYAPPVSKVADLRVVESPFFCEISSSTPDILNYFSPDDYSKGLLPRYLVFFEKARTLRPNPPSRGDIPVSLRKMLETFTPSSSTQTPEPLTALFEEEAHDLLQRFSRKVDAERNRIAVAPETPHQLLVDAALGRLREHAQKLSLLGTIRRDARYLVPLRALQWGISLALLSFRTTLQMIEEGVYENRTEEMRARVLGAVERASNGQWIPKVKLVRNIKYLNARELTDILLKLQEEQRIEIQKRGERQIYLRSRKKKEKTTS